MINIVKVLLDTSVFISSFSGTRVNDSERTIKAQCIIKYLEENKCFQICYSERTQRELKWDKNIHKLNKYELLNSHVLNQTYDNTEEKWNNIATIWNDLSEIQLGDDIEKVLPDKPSKSNKNDRGIYADALYEGCKFIIHENPKDFNKLNNYISSKNIVLIDLMKHTCLEVIEILEKEIYTL